MAGATGDMVLEAKALYKGIIEGTKYPEQYEYMLELLIRMFELHMEKNNNYGSADIVGFGTNGIIIKMWDKMCRLMNLNGYKITKIEIENMRIKEVSNGSEFLDMAIYSIIAKCLLNNKWGK